MGVSTLNLFVKNESISNLWELEAIGIRGPSDKPTKQEQAMAAKDLFLQTQYDAVFREWESEGIIERLENIDGESTHGHYLPHRPVVNEELYDQFSKQQLMKKADLLLTNVWRKG
ncbi:hypothetical protein NQ315_017519 [Exocentrus adspersus]|uniref:Uncharacterized protein n=1 Tax=Exocentrus adspersus TaxID=1586481 RepID=A0AAV8VJR1_9CUCU|nr:hypothetical protein NQ315_017519 [Exocentrus adspersus]